MKNLGSGMDSILKMVLGVLALSGILIMVISTIDMGGSKDATAAQANNTPSQLPAAAPSAVPTPAQSSMPAASAVPANAQGDTAEGDDLTSTDSEFGSPMMDPSPSTIDGNSSQSDAAPNTPSQPSQVPTPVPGSSSNTGGAAAPAGMPQI